MNPRLLPGAVLLPLVLAGCRDAAQPQREAPYAFAIDCARANCDPSAGNLQLVFRWPADALPMRIWVEPGSNLHAAVSRAIQTWEAAALYGEFRGVLVADSSIADVWFQLGPSFSSSNAAAGNGHLEEIDCSGSTTLDVQLDTTIILPRLTNIKPRSGRNRRDLESCYTAVAAHELGHSLGLLLHSDVEDDLMHALPRLEAPSARDRATFTLLYHTTPTVRLPSGR